MKKENKSPNLIPSSFTQAFYAGLVASGLSFVLGVPIEFIPRVAVAGMSYSVFLSWQDGRRVTTKKSRGRLIPFNHGKGSDKIRMEFSAATGGYIARESYLQAIVRNGKNLLGNRKKINKSIPEPEVRPSELEDFLFYSQGLQLREVHVKLFLKSAWRNRKHGKGLSARRWVRNFNQCPAWYQELSPAWYYAVMELIMGASEHANYQLVIRYQNSWLSLANEPRLTLRILRWYRYEQRRE